MTAGLGFAVLAGCFYGAYLVSSRNVAGIAPPRALLFSQLVIGAVLLAPLGLSAIPEIDLTVAWLLLLSAAASATGNLLLTIAYGSAPATRLAPFVYFQLIAATALGWTVFGDLPDGLTALGLVLLIASGFASFALRR